MTLIITFMIAFVALFALLYRSVDNTPKNQKVRLIGAVILLCFAGAFWYTAPQITTKLIGVILSILVVVAGLLISWIFINFNSKKKNLQP